MLIEADDRQSSRFTKSERHPRQWAPPLGSKLSMTSTNPRMFCVILLLITVGVASVIGIGIKAAQTDTTPKELTKEDVEDAKSMEMLDAIYMDAATKTSVLDQSTWNGLTDSQRIFLRSLGWDPPPDQQKVPPEPKGWGAPGSYALKGEILEGLRIYSPDKNDTHVAFSYKQEQAKITYALIKALKVALNKEVKPRAILKKFSGHNPAAVAWALSVKDESGKYVDNPNLPSGNELPLVRAARDGLGTDVVYLLLFGADPSLSLKENINTDLEGNAIEISDGDPAVQSLLSKSGAGYNVPGIFNITARQFLGDALNQMQLYVKNKEVILALKNKIDELDRLAEAQNNRAGTDPKKLREELHEKRLWALKKLADEKAEFPQRDAAKAQDEVIDDGPGAQSCLDVPLEYLLALKAARLGPHCCQTRQARGRYNLCNT
jgi:hypothetical protein